jgi:hypothetical protein
MTFPSFSKGMPSRELFSRFNALVGQIEKESIEVVPNSKFTSIKSDAPLVIKNAKTTGAFFSEKAVLAKDCEELGDIAAPIVVLIRCKNTGTIIAKECHSSDSSNKNVKCVDLYLYNSLSAPPDQITVRLFSGIIEGDYSTIYGTVELIDKIVQGAIIFRDKQGIPFRGRILMNGKSGIGDLARTNGDIYYEKEKVERKAKEKTST